MGFYVPYNYIKLYSSKEQSVKTLDIVKIYANKNNTITDATAGIGGNSLMFAQYYKCVNCVELDLDAYKIMKNNLKMFKNCNFYNNSYIDICKTLKQEIIFLDPPWESNYKSKEKSKLELSNIPIKNIIENLHNYCNLLVLKCPINFECIVNNWDFTTHYLYKGRRVVYKIIVYHKYI